MTLEHQGEKVDVRAYLKEVDEGFGLGQQNTAEKGIRKVGVDGRSQISERFYLRRRSQLAAKPRNRSDSKCRRAQLRYENDGFTAFTGLIHASDKFADGQKLDSNLAEAGVSKKFGDVTVAGQWQL